MKVLYLTIVVMLISFGVTSQNKSSIASSLGIFVFPSNDQTEEQQDADEVACYRWAKEQTGYDPVNPTQYVPADVDSGPDGSAVRGAAGGAAVGAAIGSISGNMGDGAAYGAIIGGVRGRRQKKMGEQQQRQANQAAANAAQNKAVGDYKRAFSLCLEQKGYAVK